DMTRDCTTLNRCRDRTLTNTSVGRQDKRGSPVVIQAIDMACFPACLSVGARAAPEDFGNDFNAVSGTVHLALSLAS
ncbi:hypothetical protein, partial [Mesorhizobium sp.]|uniref:hypothetical protein n=1 Tax=Mesorhizobium sp. TaxID=1871066 RepID=UPI0025808262